MAKHRHFTSIIDLPHDQAEGFVYFEGLLMDYTKFINDTGLPVDIKDFLSIWTCMHPISFCRLRKNDIVYDRNGTEYRVLDEPFYSEEDQLYYVEAEYVLSNSPHNTTCILTRGDVYYAPHYTSLSVSEYKLKHLAERRSDSCPLKPLLITRTKRQPS